jgi:hypothetical protein
MTKKKNKYMYGKGSRRNKFPVLLNEMIDELMSKECLVYDYEVDEMILYISFTTHEEEQLINNLLEYLEQFPTITRDGHIVYKITNCTYLCYHWLSE